MCESPNADAIGETPTWLKNMKSGMRGGGAEAVATCPCRLNLICANAKGAKGSQNNSQRNKPRSNWLKGGGWGRQLCKGSDCVNMYMEYVCVCVCVCEYLLLHVRLPVRIEVSVRVQKFSASGFNSLKW